MRNNLIFLALLCAVIVMFSGAVSAADVPSANFTANTTNGIAPVTVQFTDTSTGNPTSWSWDFGDNSTSNEQNPVHTYTAVGAHNVSLTVANDAGNSSLAKADYVTAWNTSSVLSSNNGINIYVANDAGVKYDVYNGVDQQGDYQLVHVANTYYILKGGNGLNPIQISTDPTNKVGQITTTSNQSGTFYIVFSGGIGHLDDAILMLAVNGTIPDNFSVTITSSGYTYTLSAPSLSNPTTSSLTNVTWVDDALNETFYKSDFIYGPQSWKPANTVGYSIFQGQNSTNTFSLMFIDLDVGAFGTNQYTGVTNGSIKVDYSFNNLQTFAAFDVYGWFSACNWGTGIPMTNNIAQSGFNVQGVSAPVANFTANVTSGTSPLTVQFTDNSTNSPTSWSWNFGDGNTSTLQNPTHTYTKAGNYTVSLTATNSAGNNTLVENNCVIVSQDTIAPVVLNVTLTSGAGDLPVNQVITVTFSEPISAGAAYDRIKVITPDNKAKVISKTISGSTLTIVSAYSYNYGDTYKLVIPVGAVTDLAGNNLTNAYSSNFTIGNIPTVTGVDPVDKAGNVSTTKTITVTFSNNVTAGAAYDKIKVITPNGQAKVISKTLNGNTLTITTAYSYAPGTYTVYIPVGAVVDVAGNSLTKAYNSTFTVSAGPTVSNVNTTGLSTNKTITVTFSGNIVAGANFSKIKVITSDNKAKLATVTIKGNQLVITAAYNYTPGSYTLSIPANSLTDSNGNAIAENYTKTVTV